MALDERDYHFYNQPAKEQKRRMKQAQQGLETYLKDDKKPFKWLVLGLSSVLVVVIGFMIGGVIDVFLLSK